MIDEQGQHIGRPPSHVDIYRALGVIEGRMDGLDDKIDEGFTSLHEKIDGAFKDHELRIRVVEKVQSEQKGGWRVLATIGAIAAAVGSIVAGLWSTLFGGG